MASFRQSLSQFNWATSEPLHSLLCLPAVLVPLVLGVALGYPGTAVLMAGGAQTVGFGSFQQPLFRRSGPMVLAAVGIAVSATVGALCRDSTPALLLATAVWTLVYGLSNSLSSATAWVGQQCCVFLIVSSAAASTPGTTHDLVKSALLRGAGVLAGGALQLLIVLVLRRWFPQAQSRFSRPDFDPSRFHRGFLLQQMVPGSAASQYALRVMITGVLAVWIYRHFQFPNAYWIGMTAVLLPKPDWTQTAARSVLRVVGTLAGAAVCTLIVVALHPRGEVLTALVLLCQFLCYLLLNVNYGAFAAVLTGYICFLLAIIRLPAHDVLRHRVLATAAGCIVVVAVHLLFIGVRALFGIASPHLHTLEERMGVRSHIGP